MSRERNVPEDMARTVDERLLVIALEDCDFKDELKMVLNITILVVFW